jgi:hypothetical protein
MFLVNGSTQPDAGAEVVSEQLEPSEDSMTKTFIVAFICAASAVSVAHAQSAGAGASNGASVGAAGAGVGARTSSSGSVGIGSHGTNNGIGAGTSGGISGGGSVVTPPASAGVNQPAVDINQAQQPGVGVNSGSSHNAR